MDRFASGYQDSAAIKQIEFNTVSVSFCALSSKVSELHTYLAHSGTYSSPANHIVTSVSGSLTEMANGLAAGHKEYVLKSLSKSNPPTSTAVLFIVQPGERNVFDQRHIEYSLYENHGIRSYRLTLSEVREKTRYVTEPGTPNVNRLIHIQSGAEISVVYYRSGYAPTDFPTETEWDARLYLETTHAIKCPSLLTQISGSKKIQEILTDHDTIEKFLSNNGSLTVEPHILDQLAATFVKIYPMDTSPAGLEARKLAFEHPEKYVLKPQREGGGNNIYKENIPAFLNSISKDAWGAYILMELIVPPEFKNKILRAGELYNGNVVSELGVFGTILWNQSSGDILLNEQAGWLLRSKLESSDEGGVAAGFGCIDSVYLF